MLNKKIAILDSGVLKEREAFGGKRPKGFSLKIIGEKVVKSDEITDKIGHGTAIYYLISSTAPEADIDNIKIYDDDCELSENDLSMILEYIYSHLDEKKYDFINISMGIVRVGNVKRLQDICNRLRGKGTIIVSAFDNDGAVSFPAALEGVIGVDIDKNRKKSEGLLFIENSIVNIAGSNIMYKVPWVNPSYIIVKGTSFLCANVTGMLANSGSGRGNDNLLGTAFDNLEISSEKEIKCPEIGVAAVFPFNKETRVLARMESLLTFRVADYYSVRIMGHVGRKISSVVDDCNNEKVIRDIENIEWNDFDTLIIGHTDEISKLVGIDYKNKLLREASKRRKKVYAFDDVHMDEYTEEVSAGRFFTPVVNEKNLRKRFGKLYKTDKPVLSVVGTNSKQGKFTLQLELRKRFLNKGYNVGQIGTEPSSLLFGMDEMFSCGYGNAIQLLPEQVISYVNQMIYDITQKDVDIIITGSQTGLLGYNDNNVYDRPYIHRLFFEGINSDAIIMCINYFDEREYIEQSVKLAEGLSGGKVIAFACFPFYEEGRYGFRENKDKLNPEDRKKVREMCESIPVFFMDDMIEIDELTEKCIEFFS